MWEKQQVVCSASWDAETSKLQQHTLAFVFVEELGRRQCRSAECCLCFCPAASPTVHYILDRGQYIHNYRWIICHYQPLLWPSNKVSTGMEPPFPHPQPLLCSNILHWNFLKIFACEKLLIAFHLVSVLWYPHLKYHINSELPWVDEFTVLVNLFCWKSQMWFRNNSVHCDRNKNSSLIKSINKRDFYP